MIHTYLNIYVVYHPADTPVEHGNTKCLLLFNHPSFGIIALPEVSSLVPSANGSN